MTIASSVSKVSYSGNGSTTAFPVPFAFVRDQDVEVVLRTADGAETVLTLTTDYTLTGAGGVSGGTCTLHAPPAGESADGADDAEVLALRRAPRIVQETDYQENDPFPAQSHEAALDLLTMICQSLDERLSRAVLMPLTASEAPPSPDDIVAAATGAGDAMAGASAALAQAEAARAGAEAAQAAAELAAASTAATVPQATTDTAGKVELATAQETALGTDTERAATPAGVAAAVTAAVSTAIVDLPAGVPAGAVAHFAMAAAPLGWLKANGAQVSRADYADLFAAIGTTFGTGDGSTTFTLPDLRGEFLRGLDDGRGVDTGRALGAAQDGQNLAHGHSGSASSAGGHSHTINRIYTDQAGGIVGMSYVYTAQKLLAAQAGAVNSAGSHGHSVSISNSGGTEARPRNVALQACIKY